MLIEKHYSIIHAERVLALIKRHARDIEHTLGTTIEHTSNGREQGFSLKVIFTDIDNDIRINFAQERCGEQIVVVHGPTAKFDFQNQPEDEEMYKANRKFFDGDVKAAEYIVGLIKDAVAAAKEKEEKVGQI